MQDPTKPKVLYEIAGIPLVGHVLRLSEEVGSSRTIVIIGFGHKKVMEFVRSISLKAEFAIQAQQRGTGHAMQQTSDLLSEFDGNILVLYGDVPLLSVDTVRKLLEVHEVSGAKATVLSAQFEDPTGYGRIIRTDDGKHLRSIVEHRDADAEIRKINEINSGIYVFQAKYLFPSLAKLEPNNDQGEYYLTDVFGFLIAEYGVDSVAISQTRNAVEVSGINTKEQLLELEKIYLSAVQ